MTAKGWCRGRELVWLGEVAVAALHVSEQVCIPGRRLPLIECLQRRCAIREQLIFLSQVRAVLNFIRARAIYDAFWVPGLNHDIDRDDSLRVGLRWLAEAEGKHGGSGTIVMHPKSMLDDAPLLRRAASRWEIVSRRTRGSAGRGPVLCVWPPDGRVLELAEHVAARKALCVIPGFLYDISAWIDKVQARCLVEGSKRKS